MDDEPARIDFEQQVLAAALDGEHLARAQLLGEPRRHGPAQHRGTDVDTLDAAARDKGLDAPARDFDFWQLWHVLRV
ncbi:hypothetical protein BconGalA64_53950 [Burkholderia contaminans]|nr:hypothetical protein BconGalA64_53950 [Burkholderia contaminans]